MKIEIDFDDLQKAKLRCSKCGKFKKASTLVVADQRENSYKTKCRKCVNKDFRKE